MTHMPWFLQATYRCLLPRLVINFAGKLKACRRGLQGCSGVALAGKDSTITLRDVKYAWTRRHQADSSSHEISGLLRRETRHLVSTALKRRGDITHVLRLETRTCV